VKAHIVLVACKQCEGTYCTSGL